MPGITNIALIGARSAGKSKISRKLSRITGMLSLSTDSLISYEAGGVTIERIVADEGWKGFREREYKILKKLCDMDHLIIDCGGGILVEAPTAPEETESPSDRKIGLLKARSHIVYIHRSIDFLMEKAEAKNDPARPALTDHYRALLEWRLPMYEEVADTILDMNRLSLEEALEELSQRIRKGTIFR